MIALTITPAEREIPTIAKKQMMNAGKPFTLMEKISKKSDMLCSPEFRYGQYAMAKPKLSACKIDRRIWKTASLTFGLNIGGNGHFNFLISL